MGLLDRLAKAVAAEIDKAPRLPAGATTMSEQDMSQRAGIASQQYGYGSTTGLPRNPLLASVPFAPGMPLFPGAINPLRADGRPDPRRFEYLVAQNINITENRLVPFKTLRAAADQIDILRRCIEVRKAKLTSLDWDIVISDSASERLVAEGGGNHTRAMAEARKKYSEEIARIRKFWETPDPQNGLSFVDWLAMAVEEIDVLDAWAIWPQTTVKGDIRGLQILDGATIKPLLDDRGMRPEPEVGPAFQQILYGFPRSEFSASLDDEAADGTFTSDELAYLVRNRRANSVYGYSPTERALPLADIYLRRQQWIRAEFTDGVMPKAFLELPESATMTPDQIRAYENIFNDDLAGQTEQRNRLRFLFPGAQLKFEEGYSEKFNDALDDYLITSITGHYGVLPTEIGFSAKTGLGGSGHQQGEQDAAETIGILPTSRWIAQQISNLSYRWLGMPRELQFKFMTSDSRDDIEVAQRDDIRTRNGSITINENRSELGLPLLDTPEADMPIFVSGGQTFLLTPEGMVPAGLPVLEDGTPLEPSVEEEPIEEPKEEAIEEVKKFIRWVRKGDAKRPFEFKALEPSYAETLNKFVAVEDFEGARWYAERYLGF